MSAIIVFGMIIFTIFVAFKICGWVTDYKFTVMLKEPESIHNMERIPFWLKCLVWSRYGWYIKRYSAKLGVEAVERSIEQNELTEEILKRHKRSSYIKIFGKYVLKDEKEWAKRKLSAYRCIWAKMDG